MTVDGNPSSPDPVLQGALNVLQSPYAQPSMHEAAKRIFEEQGLDFSAHTLTLKERTYTLTDSGSDGAIAAAALAIIMKESPIVPTWGDFPVRDLTAPESEAIEILQQNVASLEAAVTAVYQQAHEKRVTHGYESVNQEKADHLITGFSVGRAYVFEPSLFAASLKINYGIDLESQTCLVVKEGRIEKIALPIDVSVLLAKSSRDSAANMRTYGERVAALTTLLDFVAAQGGKKPEAPLSEKASYLIRNFFFQIARILVNIPLFLDRLQSIKQEKKAFVALLHMLQKNVQEVRQFFRNFSLDSHGEAIHSLQTSLERTCNAMSHLLEDLEDEKSLMKNEQELLLAKINRSLKEMHTIFSGLNIASLINIWDDNGHLKTLKSA